MTRLRADLLLLAAAVVWGCAFVFQKQAMSAVGPFTFITARSLVAVLVLVPVAMYEARRAQRAAWMDLLPVSIISGVLFFGGAALQQAGLATATVTNTGFLTALYVVFTPLAAWAWHRQAPPLVILPAVLLSFAGAWLLSGGSAATLLRGDVLVAAGSILWAMHVVATGLGARHDRPVLFIALQFAVVAVLAGLATAGFETVSIAGLRAASGAIAYVGILSSALTFTVFTVAMRYTPPAETAVIASTESLFGALAGALLLGESLVAMRWLGAALMLSAIVLIQLAPARFKPAAAPPLPS
jgi:drug/metabolite transporter (DMT)-like permease